MGCGCGTSDPWSGRSSMLLFAMTNEVIHSDAGPSPGASGVAGPVTDGPAEVLPAHAWYRKLAAGRPTGRWADLHAVATYLLGALWVTGRLWHGLGSRVVGG